MKRYAVMMAGGSGERFWPESRTSKPKQFLTLVGERSLIQQSYDRIQGVFPAEQILVVVGKAHLKLAREHLSDLPAENFIVEPQGKNTAPCIGLAAIHVRRRDPDAAMMVFPADHLIRGLEEFHRCLHKGFEWAYTDDHLVTVGILPSRPETGYGYVERDETAIDKDPSVYPVRRFVEKPTLEKAAELMESGHNYWNSGIFFWRANLILDKIRIYLPELYEGLITIDRCIGTEQEEQVMASVFESLPNISIDYGVMEKSEGILMIQGSFNWEDLGSWGALAGISSADANGMVITGNHVGVETTDCMIYGKDALIATLGVKDLVIVQSEDVTLVCDKNRTQEIKELLRQLKEQRMEKYL